MAVNCKVEAGQVCSFQDAIMAPKRWTQDWVFSWKVFFLVEVKSVELSEDEVTIYRGPNRDPSIQQNPDFLGRVVTLGVPQYEGDIVKYVLPSGETEAVIQVGRYTKLYIALLTNIMCLWFLEYCLDTMILVSSKCHMLMA